MIYDSDPCNSCVVEVPTKPIKANRVVVTVISSGYDDWLESWLESWKMNAGCPDVKIVVIVINGTERLERICAKYKALVIRGQCTAKPGPYIKSTLYSISRWVTANQYLVMDSDILVTESLKPLFDLYEDKEDHLIGVCPWYNLLGMPNDTTDPRECSTLIYQNDPEDFDIHLAEFLGDHKWKGLNSGLLIGKKQAFDTLDSDMRSLPESTKEWITNDHATGSVSVNEEFVCATAIAKRDALSPLPPAYNFVMWSGKDGPRETRSIVNQKTKYQFEGQDVPILHFMALMGKSLIPKYRKDLKLIPYDPEIGPCPFPFYYREREGLFDFHDLYRSAVEECPSGTMVEVGCFDARSLVFLAEIVHASGKDIQIHGIDYWLDLTTKARSYRKILEDIIRYGLDKIITMRQMASMEAAPLYEDKSLAMVFLNGEPSYEGTHEDISLWKDKVKVGGILAGHNYTYAHAGVMCAVQEQLGKPFYYQPRTWVFQRTETGWEPLSISRTQRYKYGKWNLHFFIKGENPEHNANALYDSIQNAEDGAWLLIHFDPNGNPLLEGLRLNSMLEFLNPEILCREDIRNMTHNKVMAMKTGGPEKVTNLIEENLYWIGRLK